VESDGKIKTVESPVVPKGEKFKFIVTAENMKKHVETNDGRYVSNLSRLVVTTDKRRYGVALQI
jgi:hypothetical protein